MAEHHREEWVGHYQALEVEVMVFGTTVLSQRHGWLIYSGWATLLKCNATFLKFILNSVIEQAKQVDALSSHAEAAGVRLVLPSAKEFVNDDRHKARVKNSEAEQFTQVRCDVDLISGSVLDYWKPLAFDHIMEVRLVIHWNVNVPLICEGDLV